MWFGARNFFLQCTNVTAAFQSDTFPLAMHLRRQRREEECWQREQEAAQLPGWWLRCALLVRAAEGGRHLSLPALHQKSGNSTQIMESKEASEAALLPEQIKVLQRAQQLLQPN